MPEAPKIFISASTPDLRSARQAACDALLAMGCQPVVAANEQTDSGAFWHSLQPALRGCRAVVHIVGLAYGDEPQGRQAAEHRRSYAQLEYDLAVALRRPLSVVVCTNRYPFDPFPGEDAEKQRLQSVHRHFVQGGGRAFQLAESAADLQTLLSALRVPGMAPIVPVLTPLPAVRPGPATPAPVLSESVASWMSHAPRRRLFRWVAVGLAVCILALVTSVVVLTWMLLKRNQAFTVLPASTRPVETQAAPPDRVMAAQPAPASPPSAPVRESSPVPMVRQSSPVPIARPPAPAPPVRPQTPAPVASSAPRPSPPSPVVGLNPAPAAAPAATPAPVAAERTQAKVPGGVQADRSPIDAATRKAIVDRIALAPDIPEDKKERVRDVVSRAHEMRRVLVLPFASGQSQLAAGDVTALRDLLHAPDFAAYREDPTCAFIVLGFADSRGADEYNLRLSTDRARQVRDLLRKDSTLHNVIHPVGLGKTTLLDEQQLEKNRIAEVWVIRL